MRGGPGADDDVAALLVERVPFVLDSLSSLYIVCACMVFVRITVCVLYMSLQCVCVNYIFVLLVMCIGVYGCCVVCSLCCIVLSNGYLD